jgi:hypothetical protein
VLPCLNAKLAVRTAPHFAVSNPRHVVQAHHVQRVEVCGESASICNDYWPRRKKDELLVWHWIFITTGHHDCEGPEALFQSLANQFNLSHANDPHASDACPDCAGPFIASEAKKQSTNGSEIKNPRQNWRGRDKVCEMKRQARAAGFVFAVSRMPATMLDGTGSKQNGSIEYAARPFESDRMAVA